VVHDNVPVVECCILRPVVRLGDGSATSEILYCIEYKRILRDVLNTPRVERRVKCIEGLVEEIRPKQRTVRIE
jgi:hypothetical protein